MPAPKKISTGMGRVLEEWPPVPHPTHYRVEAVIEWMAGHRNGARRAETTAWLLAVICELEQKGHPLPARRRLALALNEWKGDTVIPSASLAMADPKRRRPERIDSIDSSINSAIYETEITEEYRAVEGAHSRRGGVQRHRYLHPCQELMDAYRAATRTGVGAAADTTRVGVANPTRVAKPKLAASN